jgi:hypothetical protein
MTKRHRTRRHQKLQDQASPVGDPADSVLQEVAAALRGRDAQAENGRPDGTLPETRAIAADTRHIRETAAADGRLTWSHLLGEQACTALAEADWAQLRAALLQIAITVTTWIEAGDRRTTVPLNTVPPAMRTAPHTAPGTGRRTRQIPPALAGQLVTAALRRTTPTGDRT